MYPAFCLITVTNIVLYYGINESSEIFPVFEHIFSFTIPSISCDLHREKTGLTFSAFHRPSTSGKLNEKAHCSKVAVKY